MGGHHWCDGIQRRSAQNEMLNQDMVNSSCIHTMHICMHMCVYVYVSLYEHKYANAHMHVHVHTCMHVHAYFYAYNVYVRMCTRCGGSVGILLAVFINLALRLLTQIVRLPRVAFGDPFENASSRGFPPHPPKIEVCQADQASQVCLR